MYFFQSLCFWLTLSHSVVSNYFYNTRVYPKVSVLAAWSENYK